MSQLRTFQLARIDLTHCTLKALAVEVDGSRSLSAFVLIEERFPGRKWKDTDFGLVVGVPRSKSRGITHLYTEKPVRIVSNFTGRKFARVSMQRVRDAASRIRPKKGTLRTNRNELNARKTERRKLSEFVTTKNNFRTDAVAPEISPSNHFTTKKSELFHGYTR